MNVIASNGLKVPMEDKPYSYIDDQTSVAVEESAYYARRIADGDLLVVVDEPQAAQSDAKAVKKAGDK